MVKMAILIPFSDSFSINNGIQKTHEYKIGYGRELRSLTIEVVDEGLGPVHVNVRLVVSENTHSIGQPTSIYHGGGYNAKRFVWQGNQPIDRRIINEIHIDCTNYCGDNIKKVKLSGVKQR